MEILRLIRSLNNLVMKNANMVVLFAVLERESMFLVFSSSILLATNTLNLLTIGW